MRSPRNMRRRGHHTVHHTKPVAERWNAIMWPRQNALAALRARRADVRAADQPSRRRAGAATGLQARRHAIHQSPACRSVTGWHLLIAFEVEGSSCCYRTGRVTAPHLS